MHFNVQTLLHSRKIANFSLFGRQELYWARDIANLFHYLADKSSIEQGKSPIYFTIWQTRALLSKGNRQFISLFGRQELYWAREIANLFHYLADKSSIEQGESPISFTFWQTKALLSKWNRQYDALK
jgi:hypothetical protein